MERVGIAAVKNDGIARSEVRTDIGAGWYCFMMGSREERTHEVMSGLESPPRTKTGSREARIRRSQERVGPTRPKQDRDERGIDGARSGLELPP